MAIASAYQSAAGLTLKQQLFCQHYLSNGGNATQAIIDAGYNVENRIVATAVGTENLAKPLIKKYLGPRMKEAVEKAGVGLNWRLDMLKNVAEKSASASGKDDKGNALFDGATAIKAVAEMNKMDGSYAPTNSNFTVTEASLDDAKEVAEEAEKEINDIKTF